MIKGIGLISGGLDSILAAGVIRQQGIEVLGISFVTPFFNAQGAQRATAALDIPLEILDITEAHLAMLRNPPHGYGGNMNPCIDCHALMLREAGKVMEGAGGDFLFTGEVLGQRPMSQNKASLRIVEEESGYAGRILRPLSAKLLPETVPEKEGLVDREQLLDIKGRPRKIQMALAQEYNITEHLSPAGGCLLTDPIFSRRLKDLFQNQEDAQVKDIELLKVGRHLRLSSSTKVIVGRHEQDNETIAQLLRPDDDLIKVEGHPGPLVLIPHGGSTEAIEQTAAICARYSDAPQDGPVIVTCRRGENEQEMEVTPCPTDLPKGLMI